MKFSSTTVLFLLAPVFGFGCRGCQGNDPGEQPGTQFTVGEFEGDDVGECTDQADNDRDGYFDCKDNGCWGHPDCEGQTGNGTGTATGGSGTGNTTTGTTTETTPNGCVGDICDITSVAIEYSIDVYVDPMFEGFGGMCSCQMLFSGEAVVYEIRDTSQQITLGNGRWEQTNLPATTAGPCGGFDFCECGEPTDPCTWGFEEGLWWDQINHDAYQSFAFDNNTSSVLNWIVHDVATTYMPSATPLTDRQFYITALGAPYDATETSPVASAVLVEVPPDLAIFGGQVTHTWTATFQK